MVDKVTRDKRSAIMRAVKGKHTSPEMLVRRGLHSAGFRYVLHSPKLPGRPDIVLPKYNAIILINGCFWHGHHCHLGKLPYTRTGFWREKIGKNQLRDQRNLDQYLNEGWRVLVVWECSLRSRSRMGPGKLTEKISDWLRSDGLYTELIGHQT